MYRIILLLVVAAVQCFGALGQDSGYLAGDGALRRELDVRLVNSMEGPGRHDEPDYLFHLDLVIDSGRVLRVDLSGRLPEGYAASLIRGLQGMAGFSPGARTLSQPVMIFNVSEAKGYEAVRRWAQAVDRLPFADSTGRLQPIVLTWSCSHCGERAAAQKINDCLVWRQLEKAGESYALSTELPFIGPSGRVRPVVNPVSCYHCPDDPVKQALPGQGSSPRPQ